eukprot:904338-Ditylum_brightwellii.AAC.1
MLEKNKSGSCLVEHVELEMTRIFLGRKFFLLELKDKDDSGVFLDTAAADKIPRPSEFAVLIWHSSASGVWQSERLL